MSKKERSAASSAVHWIPSATVAAVRKIVAGRIKYFTVKNVGPIFLLIKNLNVLMLRPNVKSPKKILNAAAIASLAEDMESAKTL